MTPRGELVTQGGQARWHGEDGPEVVPPPTRRAVPRRPARPPQRGGALEIARPTRKEPRREPCPRPCPHARTRRPGGAATAARSRRRPVRDGRLRLRHLGRP